MITVILATALAAPAFSAPVHVTDQTVWRTVWNSVPGAAVYQIYLDGRAIGIQPAYVGATQGFVIPVTCGRSHTLNVRAGDTTAKQGSSSGWGPLGTRRTWTVPPC